MRGGWGVRRKLFFYPLSLSLSPCLFLCHSVSLVCLISHAQEWLEEEQEEEGGKGKKKKKNRVLVAWLELVAVLAAGARQVATDRYVKCQLNGG